MTEKILDDLHDYEKKRIYLVKHALYKAYTESRIEKISIQKIMNILLLLFQSPVVLSLYREESKSIYRNIYNTIGDSGISDDFYKYLSKYNIGNERNDYLSSDYIDEYLHIIPSMGYGFLIFNITRKEKEKIKVIFNIVSRSPNKYNHRERNSNLFEALWGMLNKTPYAYKIGLSKHVKNVLDDLKIKHPNYNNSTIFTSENIPPVFHVKCINGVKDVIEVVYKSIYRTPLLSTEEKFPPNVFFFIKTYTKDNYTRFHNYNYEVSIILCDTQKYHVEKTLQLIRNSQSSSDGTWSFPLTKFTTEDGKTRHDMAFFNFEKNDEYPNENLKNKFWELLSGKNGIDIIIAAIEAPFGENAMSLVDPSMSSELLYVRRKPFLYGGLDRISSKIDYSEIDLSDKKNVDILRIISIYYLMASASPESSIETLRVLVMPTKISGATVFCTATTTTSEEEVKINKYIKELEEENITEKEKKLRIENKENKLREEDSTWDYFYHFATDIGTKVTNISRNVLKKKYIELIDYIFKTQLHENVILIKKGEFNFKSKDFIVNVNNHFIWMSRIYPYNVIQISDENSYNKNQSFKISKDIFYMSFIENPFFDKSSDRIFISDDFMLMTVNNSSKKAIYSLGEL